MKTQSKNSKNILVLSMLLLSTGFLSGCRPVGTETPGKTPEDTAAEENAGNETKTYSASDLAVFNGANELKDIEFCEKITDETYRQSCKTKIINTIASENAIAKLDTAECEKIATEDERQACKINIEVEIQKATKIKTDAEAEIQDRDSMQSAITSNNLASCKDLKLDSSQVDCELAILVRQAIENNDLARCNQASAESTKEKCKNNADYLLKEQANQL